MRDFSREDPDQRPQNWASVISMLESPQDSMFLDKVNNLTVSLENIAYPYLSRSSIKKNMRDLKSVREIP